MKLLICNFLQPPVNFFPLGSNTLIVLMTLLQRNINIRSSLAMRDQVSHPYKATNTIVFPQGINGIFKASKHLCCFFWGGGSITGNMLSVFYRNATKFGADS
jgi:hypothetical protein